jgi:hypothetical protein
MNLLGASRRANGKEMSQGRGGIDSLASVTVEKRLVLFVEILNPQVTTFTMKIVRYTYLPVPYVGRSKN